MTKSAPWRGPYIARNWTSACLSRRCINCTCGRSLELEEEETDDSRDYDLTLDQ